MVVAGLAGDTGKSVVTLGLARALVRRGVRVAPFKNGPDFIDAAWLDAHPGSRERWAEYEANARTKASSQADMHRLLGTALFLFRAEYDKPEAE